MTSGTSALEAPLRFRPVHVAKPWGGGERLRRFGVSVPTTPPTGEVWLLSDLEGRSSVVVDGPYAGRTLADVLRERPLEVLGGATAPGGRFPVLVKLLEVEGKLSVQVHPDSAAAQRLGDGMTGKFEAWSVLEAAPGSRVSLGLAAPASSEDLRLHVQRGTLGDRLNTFTPRAGDAFSIATGTIHSVTGGVLLLEVQETADVTYRLFDWGAVGLDGKPRELHVDKALACARLEVRQPPEAPPTVATGRGVRVRSIVGRGAGPFLFDELVLEAGACVPLPAEAPDRDRGAGPSVLVGVSGTVALIASGGGRTLLSAGDAALWPASLVGRLEALSPARVAHVTPGD